MKFFKKSLATLSKMMGFVFLIVALSSISVKGQTILSEGFENPQSSWNSYTTDTIGFDSGPWSLVEVLPENGPRVYQGSKAARINDDKVGASITTPALDSVGTVSFYYVRPYSGTGEFVLQKSVSGGAFTSLDTVNYTNDTLPNFYQYNYDINDASQNIKIRVLNDDNTAQLSVDEFEVTQYSASTSGGGQSTAASIPYFQDFQNDSLNGWRSYSILSNADWSVSSFDGDFFAEINGFGADTNSNDWLISPRFDISNIQGNVYFSFFNTKNFSGGNFNVKVSNDYDGTSNPDSNQFTWNDVTSQVALSTGNYQDTFSGYLNLAPYQDDSVYIAFHYTSGTSPGSAALRRVDDVQLLTDTNAIPDIRFAEVSPDSNEATIKNYGHFPYDISGWQLCAKFNYNAISSSIVEEGDLMLNPGEEVTIAWNNITPSDQDLGLYNSNNFTDTAAMEDFLQWGSAGNGRENVADNKGIWTAGNFLTVATPYEYVGQGDPDHGIAFWESKDMGSPSTAAIPYSQDFEDGSLDDWTSYNVMSNENWEHSSFGGDFFAEVSGFQADTNSNDWLISPEFDFTGKSNLVLSFYSAKNFSGGSFDVKISTNYDGSSDPTNSQFVWNDLTNQADLSDSNFIDTYSGPIDLSNYNDTSVYIAFHYTATPNSAATWQVDDIEVKEQSQQPDSIIINEILADNQSINTDQNGENDPWIELYNPNPNAVNLKDYSLTDDASMPTKYTLPDTTIQGNDYMLVWADGDNNQSGLHTNFSLNASGGNVHVYDSLQNLMSSVTYNMQNPDTSLARIPDGAGSFKMAQPTPSAENSELPQPQPSASIPYFQDFEDGSLDDWTSYNVMSNENWEHTSFGGDFFAEASGFQADTNSNDWLISPKFDFTGKSNLVLSFYSAKNFSGGSLDIKISTNYDGVSDPTDPQFTWTNITNQAELSDSNYTDTYSGLVDVSGYNDNSVYIAFHYTATPSSAATWQIDDIEVKEQSQQPDSIIINEILADNQTINTDQNGENDPWIELYNPNPNPVNLKDYSLTDDASMPTKYTLPDTTIQGNGYMLVWADGDNNQSGLHTNFSLNASGGNVHVYDSLQNLMDSVTYNMQKPDTSLARIPDGTGAFKMAQPTPSAENTELPQPQPSASIPYFQDFENGSLEGWKGYNVQSNENWRYDSFEGDHFAEVNGFQADANSNDWLISPEFDFTGFDNLAFSFYSAKNFSGGDFKVKVSTNYDGISDPTNAEFDWTDITAQAELSDSSYIDTYSGLIDVSNINDNSVYFAFHYTSTPSQATLWQIDDIELQEVEAPDTIKLNELLVKNQATNTDQDGENDPWIELYNPNSDTVNLADYSLSDNPNMTDKYSLPNTTIQPNDYKIVWADNDTLQAGLHAPFSLDENGGEVFFYGPQSRLIDSVTYGPQKADTSFARLPNGSGSFEMAKPTPAAKNDSFTTSINTVSDRTSFDMYPNPSEDVLNITSDNLNTKQVELFNTQGQIIFRERFDGTKLQINTSNFESGLYFIKLQDVGKGEIVNNKLIIR